ncbi:BCCT family transporter, partial [Yersinia pestis]
MLNNPRKDIPLIVTSLLCIILIALAFSLFPQQSSQMAETIFSGVTRLLGSTIQILVLLGLILVLYIAVSKYGNIRLGEGKPEYRTIPWLFMFICAG